MRLPQSRLAAYVDNGVVTNLIAVYSDANGEFNLDGKQIAGLELILIPEGQVAAVNGTYANGEFVGVPLVPTENHNEEPPQPPDDPGE